jgi:phenylacetate-CoA ligase
MTPSVLLDPRIDAMSDHERHAFVHARWTAQLAYIEEHGPSYWQRRIREHGVTADATVRLPPLTRVELREVPPWDLVPRTARPLIRRAYGTSGTTGKPVSFFWTDADWTAMVDTFARLIQRDAPPGENIALNGYHQGHIAGQLYHSALARLGAISIPRHYLFDDEEATLAQLQMFHCNTLILAEQSNLLKNGKTVKSLLAHRPRFFEELGIRWWLGSTSTLTPESRRIAADQGVQGITNLFGSAEFGALAVSCWAQPLQYHIGLGHAIVEIVDDQGAHVRSGDRGHVVVSLLSSVDEGGELGPRIASQLLRVDNGDEATFLAGPCPCGLTAPRVQDIRRAA